MNPTTNTRRDPTRNLSGEAVVFLIVAIILGMVFGRDMYAIGAGVAMLALTAAVYFGGIVWSAH